MQSIELTRNGKVRVHLHKHMPSSCSPDLHKSLFTSPNYFLKPLLFVALIDLQIHPLPICVSEVAKHSSFRKGALIGSNSLFLGPLRMYFTKPNIPIKAGILMLNYYLSIQSKKIFNGTYNPQYIQQICLYCRL